MQMSLQKNEEKEITKNILAENKVIRPKMDECKGDSSHGVEWVENILLSPLRI